MRPPNDLMTRMQRRCVLQTSTKTLLGLRRVQPAQEAFQLRAAQQSPTANAMLALRASSPPPAGHAQTVCQALTAQQRVRIEKVAWCALDADTWRLDDERNLTYSDGMAGAVTCDDCAPGKYGGSSAATICTLCPTASTSPVASTALTVIWGVRINPQNRRHGRSDFYPSSFTPYPEQVALCFLPPPLSRFPSPFRIVCAIPGMSSSTQRAQLVRRGSTKRRLAMRSVSTAAVVTTLQIRRRLFASPALTFQRLPPKPQALAYAMRGMQDQRTGLARRVWQEKSLPLQGL